MRHNKEKQVNLSVVLSLMREVAWIKYIHIASMNVKINEEIVLVFVRSNSNRGQSNRKGKKMCQIMPNWIDEATVMKQNARYKLNV